MKIAVRPVSQPGIMCNDNQGRVLLLPQGEKHVPQTRADLLIQVPEGFIGQNDAGAGPGQAR